MGKWVEGYGYSHKDISIAKFQLDNQTIRYVVPIGINGSRVEIAFSNRYGTEDLILDKVTIAKTSKGDILKPNSLSKITYNSYPKMYIPKGQEIICDILDFDLYAGDELAISIYIKNMCQIKSGGSCVGRRYVSIPGDYTEINEIPLCKLQKEELNDFTEPTVDIISHINIFTKEDAYCIAALGDSITAMDYWRGPLATRLQEEYYGQVSILNYGITGNRYLYPTGMRGLHGIFGEAGKVRIFEELLKIKGLKYIILLEGTNDLTQPGINAPISQSVTAQQLIEAYEETIEKLNQCGIRVIGCTLPPFEGMGPGYSEQAENYRKVINWWIRNNKTFYAIIDFDKLLADKDHEKRFQNNLHIGDWLHPNKIAGKLITEHIELNIFSDNTMRSGTNEK